MCSALNLVCSLTPLCESPFSHWIQEFLTSQQLEQIRRPYELFCKQPMARLPKNVSFRKFVISNSRLDYIRMKAKISAEPSVTESMNAEGRCCPAIKGCECLQVIYPCQWFRYAQNPWGTVKHRCWKSLAKILRCVHIYKPDSPVCHIFWAWAFKDCRSARIYMPRQSI